MAPAAPQPLPAWRLAVIGPALGPRLQRPGLLRGIGRPLQLLGPYADAAQAAAALERQPADALLLHAPQLPTDGLPALLAGVPAAQAAVLQSLPKALLYGFGADAQVERLATDGVALLREPQPDAVLAQWLRGVAQTATLAASAAAAAAAPAPAAPANALAGLPERVSPRRWDDAALADVARLSTTVACECPRHVAELLVQLTHFEDYSAQCTHRNASDADLHRFLGRVAGDARARFEAALEQVALHEGLLLPPTVPPTVPST